MSHFPHFPPLLPLFPSTYPPSFLQSVQLDAQDPQGNTPLHMAAANGHVAVTRLLLKAGARHSPMNVRHETPLHVASKWGTLWVVETLLACGASVLTQTLEGASPLHLANNPETARLLIAKKADVKCEEMEMEMEGKGKGKVKGKGKGILVDECH